MSVEDKINEVVKKAFICPKCGAKSKFKQIPINENAPRADPLEAFRPIGPGGKDWSPTHLLPIGGPPITIDELRRLHTPFGPNPNIIKKTIMVCTKCDWTSEEKEESSSS